MAGDWIKMRTDLYRDPKVCVMADILAQQSGDLASYVNQNQQRDMCVTRNVMRNVTVGALVSVWGVLRLRGKRIENDLIVAGASLAVIDDVADLPGFGAAMSYVGWAEETEKGVVFPRFFEDYNVDPASDAKAQNAERQRRFREKGKGDSNAFRNVTVTQKRNARVETEKSITGTERIDPDPARSVETIGEGGFGKYIANKLPPRDSGDLRFLMLVGRAVDERHISESLVHPALVGCDAKGVRKPIGMFRAALEKNIAAAGGDLEAIMQTLQGGGDGSSD